MMNTLYHWIGLIVFWNATAATGIVAAWSVWESDWFRHIKRRLSHIRIWFRVLVRRKVPTATRGGAYMIFMMASRKAARPYAWWERNLAAYIVKHARRTNFAE